MNNPQDSVQKLLDQLVASGAERGVQAAAYYRGELVVDAFAGIANPQTQQPVTAETLFPVFSTTKGVLATIIHRLAERGILNYHTPIADYWPEFAAHAKENITIRHALNHTAGLPYIPLSIGLDQIGDWNLVCAALADATPASAPGERTEYHAITFGWLLGEVAQRASGRAFADLWREEICAPLGLESTMFCGLPAGRDADVAILEEPDFVAPEPPVEPTPQAIPYWIQPLGEWMNRSEGRRACLPASNGIMTAKAIARHYAALVPGGVDGIDLLPPSRVRLVCTREQAREDEELSKFGFGYASGNPQSGHDFSTFGHGGYGGSQGLADADNGWSFGFTRNRFGTENSAENVLNTLKVSLGIHS